MKIRDLKEILINQPDDQEVVIIADSNAYYALKSAVQHPTYWSDSGLEAGTVFVIRLQKLPKEL